MLFLYVSFANIYKWARHSNVQMYCNYATVYMHALKCKVHLRFLQ